MRAQKKISHSDVSDTEADNSVTSRMELCIITNLEFNIGKRKRRETRKWQALQPQRGAESLFGSPWRRVKNNNDLEPILEFSSLHERCSTSLLCASCTISAA